MTTLEPLPLWLDSIELEHYGFSDWRFLVRGNDTPSLIPGSPAYGATLQLVEEEGRELLELEKMTDDEEIAYVRKFGADYLFEQLGMQAVEQDLLAFGQNGLTSYSNSSPLMAIAIVYLLIAIPITQLVAWMERRQQKAR